jgi:hypothetical protein
MIFLSIYPFPEPFSLGARRQETEPGYRLVSVMRNIVSSSAVLVIEKTGWDLVQWKLGYLAP